MGNSAEMSAQILFIAIWKSVFQLPRTMLKYLGSKQSPKCSEHRNFEAETMFWPITWHLQRGRLYKSNLTEAEISS